MAGGTFGVELDGAIGFGKWEWGQLVDPRGFKWDPVTTPFANPNVSPPSSWARPFPPSICPASRLLLARTQAAPLPQRNDPGY